MATRRRTFPGAVAALAVTAVVARAEFDPGTPRVHRDEGPAARWAWQGFEGDVATGSFSGPEAVVGGVLLYWSNAELQGVDLATGRILWTKGGLGNRECGYPDVGLVRDAVVVPAFARRDETHDGQLQVIDTRHGGILSTVSLGPIQGVHAISCSPCVVQVSGFTEREPASSLHAVDLGTRSIVATLPGWELVSEVEDGTVLARRSEESLGAAEACRSVDLLGARSLASLWSAEVGCVQAAWRSGPWWIVAAGDGACGLSKLVRIDAADGRIDGVLDATQLVGGTTGCREEGDGHAWCLEARADGLGPSMLARLDPETGTTAWAIGFPADLLEPRSWCVLGGALLVEGSGADGRDTVSVFDWPSGRARGRLWHDGENGWLSAHGTTLLRQRDDASLVAYDMPRLLQSVTPRP